MRKLIPTIVTHPQTLFRDGLREILGHTPFQPVHLAAELDQAAITHLTSAETCLWLLGVEKCSESTFDLVRRVCATKPGVKVVILSQFQIADDVWPAIEAGARGFLYHSTSSERLVKALELIALGEMIVPTEFLCGAGSRLIITPSEHPKQTPALQFHAGGSANGANGHEIPSDEQPAALIKGMSRRETSILRLLMQGTSNKLIARQLVITEATVKVHIKAILRKLRLHNRTQAAMWACNHLGDDGDASNIVMSANPHAGRIAPADTKSAVTKTGVAHPGQRTTHARHF